MCLYAFDLLFLNGESLLKAPLSRRRTLLKDSFREVVRPARESDDFSTPALRCGFLNFLLKEALDLRSYDRCIIVISAIL